jgi:hypothetical protein
MTDYTGQWDAEQARLLAAHIGRTAGRLEVLAERYAELRSMLAAGGGGKPADGMPGHGPAGPRVPIRVEVLDTMAEIDDFLAGFLPLVRGVLRLGMGAGQWSMTTQDGGDARTARVRSGLLFLAGALGGVYNEDPQLGDDVSRGAWELERRAGWIFGDRSRPFALTEPCPACGVPALWVVPERMAIVCGNPACRESRPVNTALPVHVTNSGEKGS